MRLWSGIAILAAAGCGPSDQGSPTDSTTATSVTTSPTATGGTPTMSTSEMYTDGIHSTTVVASGETSEPRRYSLSTDHPQRDGAAPERVVEESLGGPSLRSGSVVFDALFALALEEVEQLSVSAISDGAFDDGAPMDCDCFQTGELWQYVWTRDTAYAMDLSLALFDPQRARNSLDFKLSSDKGALGGQGLQIVQDTGTGGSWPVSTDRVVWAFGASRVLNLLDGAEREAFRDRVLEAVIHTAELDRVTAWDTTNGLYCGETSFLDWREQTYPQWTATDTRHIAESQSLSTNVGHWALLDLAARLSAEVGDIDSQTRYRVWADDLSSAMDEGFWIENQGWSRVLPNQLDRAPLDHRDWLGTALMALTVGSAERSELALSSYPHSAYGPPVIWPQQPQVPIYHNRAIWPFVTAYGVRAAAQHRNAAVLERGVESLVRGAALNLSNMENLELQTGANWFDDGAFSGPIVNSRRQLWSVAGYLSMVTDLFGIRPEADGLHFDPVVPAATASRWMPSGEVTLRSLPYKGHTVDVVLVVPGEPGDLYVLQTLLLDGVQHSGPVSGQDLQGVAEIRLTLQPASSSGARADLVDNGDFTLLYAPRDPAITELVRDGDGLTLTLDAGGETAPVTWDIWRDGVLVAAGLDGPTWTDLSVDPDTASPCYTAATRFASGLGSQHAEPVCWWGATSERIQDVTAYAMTPVGGVWGGGPGFSWWWDWGEAEHTLSAQHVVPNWSGETLIQVVHANGSGPVNTGITAGLKWLQVTDAAGVMVAEGSVVMPQSNDWSAFRPSTGVRATLVASERYTLTLSDRPNMSQLAHFEAYTGGQGGGDQAYNRADIHAFRLLPLAGEDLTPTTGGLVAFDGVDDVQKLGPDQQVPVGQTLQPWEVFGLTWDEDWVFLSWVSEAFEDDWAAAVLYLEASSTSLPVAVPGAGFEYSGLTPALPFQPTHSIGLRAQSDAGTGEGPWSGVRAFDGANWILSLRVEEAEGSWLAADRHTLSVKVPRAHLGDPTHLRFAGHVVVAQPGVEYAVTVPAAHDPTGGAGTVYEISLDGPSAAINWNER